MVKSFLWTPENKTLTQAHPLTLDLAKMLENWSFLPAPAWLGNPPGWWMGEVIPGVWKDRKEWIKVLAEASRGSEHVILLPGDAPFLNQEINREIWELHTGEGADYTFADGYPLGMTCEIVRTAALDAMVEVTPDDGEPPTREGVFAAILHSVNSFNVETYLSPKDLRGLRIDFFDSDAHGRRLIELWADRAFGPLPDLLKALDEDRVSQRSLPTYWKLQLVKEKPSGGGLQTLELNAACSLIEKVGAWMGAGVLMPGFWGEPSQHPDIFPILDMAVKTGFQIVLETSGLGWKPAVLDSLTALMNSVRWIVEVDALDPDLYRKIHGEGWEEVISFIENVSTKFPGRVYLQATRLPENEDHLETFYRIAKEKTGKVIIQKYNNLAGALPVKPTVDLSPWKRNPCWHLQRGLHVLVDGRVTPCHQFPSGENSWGNLFNEHAESVWQRGIRWMELHQKELYPEVCGLCDEYYTFQF